MKKTYIAPETQVYNIQPAGTLFLTTSTKKADPDAEVLSKKYWGTDNMWDDTEEGEEEQTTLF